jgi:valyl-tRNA synthetase
LELQPKVGAYREETVSTFENTKQVVSAIRTIRLEKNIPSRDKLELYVIGVHASELNPIVEKMAGLSAIQTLDEKPAGSVSFMVGTTEFAIPLVGFINVDEEISKIQSEIEYLNGFLEKVNQKLGNERFVNNAKPEVVESERKKKLDAEMKIRTLEENLANFKSKNQ